MKLVRSPNVFVHLLAHSLRWMGLINVEHCIMDGQKEDRRLDFIIKKFTALQLLYDIRWKRHVKGFNYYTVLLLQTIMLHYNNHGTADKGKTL